MLDLRGRPCLVVGGGDVGVRRARTLHEAGARVRLVAPDADEGLSAWGEVVRRSVEPADLDSCFLVIVATDDPGVNTQVAQWARDRGVLVNRADGDAPGDIEFMAAARRGPLTLAVHTGGVSASAAAAIRDDLVAGLDPVWARVLTLAEPFRSRIQHAFPDSTQRRERLRRLTDVNAIAILNGSGEEAYCAFAESLLTPEQSSPALEVPRPGSPL